MPVYDLLNYSSAFCIFFGFRTKQPFATSRSPFRSVVVLSSWSAGEEGGRLRSFPGFGHLLLLVGILLESIFVIIQAQCLKTKVVQEPVRGAWAMR